MIRFMIGGFKKYPSRIFMSLFVYGGGGGDLQTSKIFTSKANHSETINRIRLKFSPNINCSLGSLPSKFQVNLLVRFLEKSF